MIMGEDDVSLGTRLILCLTGKNSVPLEVIREYIEHNLNGPEKPRAFYLISSIPRTENGKIKRLELKSMTRSLLWKK